MAKKHGKNVEIFLKDSDTTIQNLTGDGNSVVLNMTTAMAETTSFGDSFVTRLAGVTDWGLTYAGFFNSNASTVDDTLFSIQGGSTSVCVAFAGSPPGTGSPVYRSEYATCTDYSVTGPVDGPVAVSFTLAAGSDMNRDTA